MNLEFYTSELMSVPKGDIVKFRFKGQKGKEVRCLKSFLTLCSPVFTTQFNDTWDKNAVELDDPVKFDQYERFKLFIEVLIKVKSLKDLKLDGAVCVYFYADKYQIVDLKSKIEDVVSSLNDDTLPSVLERSLEMVEEFGFDALKVAIDGVKLLIMNDLALGLYNTCKRFKMEKLTKKVVSFMSKMDYDASWPAVLLVEIAEQNRLDLAATEQKLQVSLETVCTRPHKRRLDESDFSELDDDDDE